MTIRILTLVGVTAATILFAVAAAHARRITTADHLYAGLADGLGLDMEDTP